MFAPTRTRVGDLWSGRDAGRGATTHVRGARRNLETRRAVAWDERDVASVHRSIHGDLSVLESDHRARE